MFAALPVMNTYEWRTKVLERRVEEYFLCATVFWGTGFGLRHSRSEGGILLALAGCAFPSRRRDLASGIPVPLAAGASKSRPLCCAQPFFAPFHPLCKQGLQRSVIAQKNRMICIIRSAFERKTGFEPAALSLGS